jgi:chromosome partitioning protein
LKNVQSSIYECIVDEVEAEKVILKTDIANLDIIPSHIDLVGAEIEMLNLPNREKVLKNAIEHLKDVYDFIFIDCSPSLGLITLNALTASDSIIIPVQCEYFALEGLGKLLNTVKIIQNRLNKNLEIEGFLLTMFDGRLNLSNQVYEEVKRHFQEMVFDTVIQRNVKLGEAPSYGKPVILYDASSKGAVNHMNLAREILQRNKMTQLGKESNIVIN